MTSTPSAEISARELLRHRDLSWFVTARFFTGVALTLMRATISWHVFALTSSAFHLGLIGLFQFLPTLVLSLVAGVIADNYRRRTVVILAQVTAIAVSSTVCVLTFVGRDSVALLYAVVIANSVAAAFDGPARQAILPTLVPREAFARAVSLNSTIQNIAWVTGPVVAGFVIADLGVAWAYLVRIFLIATSMASISRLRAGEAPVEKRASGLESVREGLRFVRQRPAILGAMSLDMFAVIFGSATALLPIYATEILGVGARGFGILSAAFDVGAVMMAVMLFVMRPMRRIGHALLVAVAIYGIATIIFGVSRSFPLSVVAFMCAGMADQVSVMARSVIIQMATPDHLRGRVSSVNLVFIGASNQLGAAESGLLAAATSASFAVVSGGVVAVLVAVAIALKVPELRKYVM